MSKKLSYKFIKSNFEKEGYIFLTNKYENCDQKLEYICPKGHYHSISWDKWKSGVRCFYCYGKIKKTIEFIKSEFEKENYILLTKKYLNNRQKLKCICPNNHLYEITWRDWNSGRRCGVCFNTIYRFGETSPNWNGGISCEPYCDVWLDKEFKKLIKERDNDRCQNIDCRKNCSHLPLTLHHIDYNKKNCEPQNLITLCRSCNSRANKNRSWHQAWYQAIMNKKFIKEKGLNYYTGG